MAYFEDHIGELIQREGGYQLTDNEADRGGKTFAGISQRWHPEWAGWEFSDATLKAAPDKVRKLVNDFYRQRFWRPMGCALIDDKGVVRALLNSAVMSGVRTATLMVQRVCGSVPDGLVGSKTVAAVNGMDPTLFRSLYALARIYRYSQIVHSDQTQARFFRGWVNRALEDA